MKRVVEEKISADLKANKAISQQTVKILANSIYTALREEGCQDKDIIGVSSQLIGLVTSAIDEREEEPSSF
ncbi:MAG: hypothetical protein HYW48_11260 [Deltaproteobacteria bacterium]|nr:hypothetical protein [Deltaproteobacteria bacterium]